MAVHTGQVGKLGAGQHQQVLGDGQVVDIHHPQPGVVIAQVQHRRHIPRVAVLKGHHAVGGIALFHGIEHLIPGGAAHSLGMGKERPERDVGKSTFHALIGGAVAAQHLGLVLLGHVHHVLHMVPVIGAQGRVPDPRFGLVQHHLFAGGIKDGQAVGLFVFRHAEHRLHPPLKQGSQLGIHRVDLPAGLFQCVHHSTSFAFRDTGLVYHNSDTETTKGARFQGG